jgi:hypothetical protein
MDAGAFATWATIAGFLWLVLSWTRLRRGLLIAWVLLTFLGGVAVTWASPVTGPFVKRYWVVPASGLVALAGC